MFRRRSSFPFLHHPGKRCHFKWDIYNPFLTGQKLEAKFYQENRTVTPWKVTFEPVGRGTDLWEFSLFLMNDDEFECQGGIVTEEVSVLVLRGDDLITSKKTENFKFCSRNFFKYYVEGKVVLPLQMEPHQLTIRVEVVLPFKYFEENIYTWRAREEDLACLSKNMKDLLKNELYTDMVMTSANPEHRYNVHSYVLEARWNKFFSKHPRPSLTGRDLWVDISNGLLSDILTYMYSGELRKNWPEWKNSRHAAEMCQVIFRYDLHHLYKAIVKSDMKQNRVTRNSSHVESQLFPLEVVKGRPVKKSEFCWSVNIYSSYRLIFRIRVGGEYGNWLSYSLESRSKFRVRIQMNFTIVKKMEGNTQDTVLHVHEAIYDIGPRETKDSEPQIFLGCPETFGDDDERRTKYYTRCFLNVIDGTKLDLVHCIGEETLQDDSERFRLLSRHMWRLYKGTDHTDMLIYFDPSARLDEWSDRSYNKEKIHRGILAARVPEWWKGFKNVVEEPNTMPREATCTLGALAIRFFLDYLYSGESPLVWDSEVDGIKRFAELTRFDSLNHFVSHLITYWRNRIVLVS